MIILLAGTNTFAIRQALDKLVAAYLNKNTAHAIDRIDGETVGVERLPELLQGASLFASKKLVIIRDASKNKQLWDALSDYIERVPDETTLVIVEATPDKRTRTYKQLQKHGKLHAFADLGEAELGTWVVAEAEVLGATLDLRTAQYLVRQVGTDQWRLYSELQKLAGTKEITPETIDALVEPNPQASVFDLLDAVLTGKSAKTREILSRLKSTEDPYKLFGLLVSQVHALAIVATASGKSPDAIAKEGGIHPFVVRKLQSIARQIQYRQVQSVTHTVAKTDVQFKSTGAAPWMLFEQCLEKIAADLRS